MFVEQVRSKKSLEIQRGKNQSTKIEVAPAHTHTRHTYKSITHFLNQFSSRKKSTTHRNMINNQTMKLFLRVQNYFLYLFTVCSSIFLGIWLQRLLFVWTTKKVKWPKVEKGRESWKKSKILKNVVPNYEMSIYDIHRRYAFEFI